MGTMLIYCVACASEVNARLTRGEEIYPHRPYLFNLPFWRCDNCNNYVGCHHKTRTPTKPLGVIPNEEIRAARRYIHALIDPVWMYGKMGRRQVYSKLSNYLGYKYHTAELRTVEQCREVYKAAKWIFMTTRSVDPK